jgi:hypothetical protein
MIKEAIEDYKRYKADKEVSGRGLNRCMLVNPSTHGSQYGLAAANCTGMPGIDLGSYVPAGQQPQCGGAEPGDQKV